MKTLLLMRHAKSSWKHAELPDAERGLAKRGKKDAPLMGHLLKEKELVPQVVLCSSAERARQTAAAVAEACGFKGQPEFQEALYLAEPEGYITALRTVPDAVERVLVIGHNPGLEGLLQMLSGRVEALPTSSIAFLSLPLVKWAELGAESEGELVEVMRAHDLKAAQPRAKKVKRKEKPEKQTKKKRK